MSCSKRGKWVWGGVLSPLLALSDALYLSHYCPLHASPPPPAPLLYTIPGSHLQDNMNENIHQCYCVICEQHTVCVCRGRDGEKRVEEEVEEGGSGWREWGEGREQKRLI